MECAGPEAGLGVSAPGDVSSPAEENIAVKRILPELEIGARARWRCSPGPDRGRFRPSFPPTYPTRDASFSFLPAQPAPATRFDEAPQCAASGSPTVIAFPEMRIV